MCGLIACHSNVIRSGSICIACIFQGSLAPVCWKKPIYWWLGAVFWILCPLYSKCTAWRNKTLRQVLVVTSTKYMFLIWWIVVLSNISGYGLFYIFICHSCFKTLNKHQLCSQVMPQYGYHGWSAMLNLFCLQRLTNFTSSHNWIHIHFPFLRWKTGFKINITADGKNLQKALQHCLYYTCMRMWQRMCTCVCRECACVRVCMCVCVCPCMYLTVHVHVCVRACVHESPWSSSYCSLKDEIRKKYETEQMPKYLGMLEKLLVSNKGGDGYFVGDKVLTLKWFYFFKSLFITTWPTILSLSFV